MNADDLARVRVYEEVLRAAYLATRTIEVQMGGGTPESVSRAKQALLDTLLLLQD